MTGRSKRCQIGWHGNCVVSGCQVLGVVVPRGMGLAEMANIMMGHGAVCHDPWFFGRWIMGLDNSESLCH